MATSTYLFKSHFNTRQWVRETLAGLDVDKEWLDDMTREHLDSSVENRVDAVYQYNDAKTRGMDSDFTGVDITEVELCWSRTDQLNRNKHRANDYVDVKRKAALSTHAAIEALADRLGMYLFNFIVCQT